MENLVNKLFNDTLVSFTMKWVTLHFCERQNSNKNNNNKFTHTHTVHQCGSRLSVQTDAQLTALPGTCGWMRPLATLNRQKRCLKSQCLGMRENVKSFHQIPFVLSCLVIAVLGTKLYRPCY